MDGGGILEAGEFLEDLWGVGVALGDMGGVGLAWLLLSAASSLKLGHSII